MANPFLNIKMNSLRTRKTELRNNREKISNQIADVQLLKNFFKSWNDAYLQNGGNNQAAYNTALSQVVHEDNPSTPFYDGLTEQELISKAETLFEKPWSEINPDDVSTVENDLNAVKSMVLELLGKQSGLDGMITGVDSEIKDVQAIKDAETAQLQAKAGN